MQAIVQILVDPAWLGIIIGALSLIVSIVALFVPALQQRKSITFNYTGGLADETVLIVWNDGNIPILRADYIDSQPLRFVFLEGASISEVTIKDTKPINLKDKILDKYTWDKNSVSLEPLDLNSYDAIKLQIKLNGWALVKIKGDIRIVGVTDPRLVNRRFLAYLIFVLTLIYSILTILLILNLTSIAIFQVLFFLAIIIGSGLATRYIRTQTDLNMRGLVRPPSWYIMTLLKFYFGSLFIGLVPYFIFQIIVHLLLHK